MKMVTIVFKLQELNVHFEILKKTGFKLRYFSKFMQINFLISINTETLVYPHA